MFIGVDLGGSHIGGGLVDNNGKIVARATVENRVGTSQEIIIDNMIQLCKKIIEKSGVKKEDISSIGIGCPGTCDDKRGIIVYENKLKMRNVPVRAEFAKHFDMPIHMEMDANCAALAESFFGAAKGYDTSVTITLGTGLGGGIVINGKIFSGFNFAGSEMGHTVMVVDGEQCTCGRRGCWEAYSSATALVNKALQAIQNKRETIILDLAGGDISKINGEIIFNAAKQGDKAAEDIIEQYIKYLAEGITNVVNTIMPEVFVIGGGVCRQGDYLLKPLQRLVNEKMYVRGDTPKTIIKIAEMQNDAGIIGAAMLGR
ncbi:MAG: ROK family protein [Deltaproteobacteria bacterium]